MRTLAQATIVRRRLNDGMHGLRVELLVQRESDAFVPRYADGLLMLETETSHYWPYGGTLDGVLTLDLDDDRVLVHVELAWPKERWPVGSVELPRQDKTPRSLRLPTLSREAVPESLNVLVARGDGLLVISWSEASNARRVPIGHGVSALVISDSLRGFAVDTQAFN